MKLHKILSLLLTAALVLSLAACGGGSGSEDSAPPADAGTTQAGDEVPAEEAPGEDEEQPPEAVFTTVTVGETVTLDGVDIELTTGEFSSDADKLGGNISVSTHSDSNKYFWLSGTMTNVGTETVSSWGIDSMVSIIFDDTYTYEGSITLRDDMGPFAESEVLFWADVPPAMLDRYETVKVQFAYNDGFAEYDWEAANYEKTMGGYDHQYEFVLGEGGAAGNSGAAGGPAAGIWDVGYYVDDFQQPTDEWYITTSSQFTGTFSNSATTNSNLAVQVLVDHENDISFFLYEYGRSQVKNSSTQNEDAYDITMRTPDGTDHKLTGTVYCGGDRLLIDDAYVDQVLTAMRGEGTISFYIVQSDRTTTTYLFSMEADNFGSVYDAQQGTQTV